LRERRAVVGLWGVLCWSLRGPWVVGAVPGAGVLLWCRGGVPGAVLVLVLVCLPVGGGVIRCGFAAQCARSPAAGGSGVRHFSMVKLRRRAGPALSWCRVCACVLPCPLSCPPVLWWLGPGLRLRLLLCGIRRALFSLVRPLSCSAGSRPSVSCSVLSRPSCGLSCLKKRYLIPLFM